ncbi:MAG TPA: phosphoserine transaminase, partial [Microbacteriaceae bacterium]|nr:phosphoserine transaminase [Microbacteriaceae bacterium]
DLDEHVQAAELSRQLRANGVVDIDSYRKLNRNQLRIGTFASVEPSDVRALTACLDYVIERL